MTPAKGRDFFFRNLDFQTHLYTSTGANMRALKTASSARAVGDERIAISGGAGTHFPKAFWTPAFAGVTIQLAF